MAEVHEICRTEFERLLGKEWDGKPYQEVYCRWYTGDLSRQYMGPRHVDSDMHSWDDLDKAVEDCSRSERYSIGRLLEGDGTTLLCIEIWHVVDDADYGWEDDLDELLMSGVGSDWRNRCALVNEAETLESLRQLREAGVIDGVEPLHDDVAAHVTESGKPKNWHIQYSFEELKSCGITGDRALFIKNFMWEYRHCGSPLHKCLSSYLDYCVELCELVNDDDNCETYHGEKGVINCNSLDEAYEMAAQFSSMPYFSKVQIVVWLHNCETTNYLVLYQFEKVRGQIYAYAEYGCHLLDIDVPKSISGIAVGLAYIPF